MSYLFNVYHVLALYLSCVASLSSAQNLKLPLKAVNLGNWLVVEGWMKPSLFDGIPNKDLLVKQFLLAIVLVKFVPFL